MKNLIRLLKTRGLSKREKILTTIFLVSFILWISYNLVLKPQAEKVEVLEEKGLQLDNEISNINKILEEEEDMRMQLTDINTDNLTTENSYFPTLDQTQIIYYIEDIFNSSGLKILDMIFSQPELEIMDELEVQYLTIAIPFKGEYRDILTAINYLNNGPFKVIMETLSLKDLNKQSIEGETSLKVYSLENIIDNPKSIDLAPREIEEDYKGFDPFTQESKEDNNEIMELSK